MMMVFYFIFGIYLLLLFAFLLGFRKYKKSDFHVNSERITFSIVVPFRNEATNLNALLSSFQRLNYKQDDFEIILVNDCSEDDFQISGFDLPILLLNVTEKSLSPKKAAIELAIQHSMMNWIVTTDADCLVPSEWLLKLSDYIHHTAAEMIAGPVFFQKENNFLADFQQIEMASLQAVTIGSFGLKIPFMCNGANLAYSKKFFKVLNGFKGNEQLASGDDVFLLQKAVKTFPEKVQFLKDANFYVSTKSAPSWKSLFYQRVRWAGKSTAYSSFIGKMTAIVVFSANCAFIGALILLFFGKLEVVPLLILKGLIDVFLAFQVANFYEIRLKHLFATYLLYPFFSSAVAIWSLFGSFEWKGRRY